MSRWIRPASCAASSASAIGREDPQRAARVELARDDHVLEVRPADQPHRDEEALLALARLVDGDDVRVVDPGLDLPLAPEALPEQDVVAQVRREHLERDGPVERELRRLVDDPHPALTEDPGDPVPGECGALLERHVSVTPADQRHAYSLPPSSGGAVEVVPSLSPVEGEVVVPELVDPVLSSDSELELDVDSLSVLVTGAGRRACSAPARASLGAAASEDSSVPRSRACSGGDPVSESLAVTLPSPNAIANPITRMSTRIKGRVTRPVIEASVPDGRA